MSETVEITKKLFPRLLKAFQEIDLDSDMTPLRKYVVPASHAHLPVAAERGLSRLEGPALDEFLTGDAGEFLKNSGITDPDIHAAHELLDAYFSNYYVTKPEGN